MEEMQLDTIFAYRVFTIGDGSSSSPKVGLLSKPMNLYMSGKVEAAWNR